MKPFLELATELPKAFATSAADQQAAQAANLQASRDIAAAKAAYDAAVAKAQAAADVAIQQATKSAAALRTLQEEINAQLGQHFGTSRVRVG